MKILVLRFSSIGDIVLTTPVLRNLKTQIPDVEVHYCTKEKFKGILENNPYIHKIHSLKDNLSDLITQLKKEDFDLIIDLHRNLRTFLIKAALRKKSYSFQKVNFKKWLLVNLKINKLPSVHIVDRYMATLISLGVKNDQKGLDYFIPALDEIEKKDLPWTHKAGYVAFAIGAQHATKKLPPEKMVELCNKLKDPILLLGDKNDKAIGDFIMEKLKGKKLIFNSCGLYNLNQSASLIQNAKYIISHDTGLMHIAAAFGKKIISIWGSTIPGFGMYPYLTEYNIIENNSLTCRPCSKIGFAKCPKGHFKCMNDLSFTELQD